MTADHVLVRCPSCGTENRIPPGKVGRKGRCGRCRSELPDSGYYSPLPVDIPEAAFDLLTRYASVPVLVDFWAEWCAPCKQMAPILEDLARETTGRLLVGKVDTEKAEMLAARFQIRAIPTLILLRSGIEVDRITGVVPLSALRDRVGRVLV